MPLDEDAIQGNILKGFARNHGVFLFVRFREEVGEIRPALGHLLADYVTSASRQAMITEKWKTSNQSAGVGMCGLSWRGYQRLQLAGAVDTSDALGGPAFRRGMKDPAYFEPGVGGWDEGYKSDVDAFVLLADSDPSRLEESAAALRSRLGPIAEIAAEEPGMKLFGGPQDGRYEIEHFGFRDGISESADPTGVLTAEPPQNGSPPGFGCYAVFMKLEQDVAGFRRQSAELAGLAGAVPEQVQTLAVGRHQDGQPLVPFGPGMDDFTFAGTPHDQCPYQSHIRVMNPRDGTAPRKILRRSLSYGPVEPPSTGSGLLFLSLQRSLLDFTYLHQRAERLRDPILAQREVWTAEGGVAPIGCVRGAEPGQTWTIQGSQICYPFANLTNLRGGEFFYIPSMRIIRRLADS